MKREWQHIWADMEAAKKLLENCKAEGLVKEMVASAREQIENAQLTLTIEAKLCGKGGQQ